MRTLAIALVVVLVRSAAGQPVPESPGAGAAGPVVLHDVLVLGMGGRAQRAVIAADPVAAVLARAAWRAPKAGEAVAGGRERAWEAGEIDDRGVIRSRLLQGGYAYAEFESPEDQVLILTAAGHSIAYVNGEPHTGDPYGTGWCRLPVEAHKGTNWVLVRGGRPEVTVGLAAPSAPVFIDPADTTLPDVREGETGRMLGAVVVVNATREWQRGWEIGAGVADGPVVRTAIDPMPPASTRKAAFEFDVTSPTLGGTPALTVALADAGGQTAPRIEPLPLRVRKVSESRRVTFRSRIDGSVQYYAVRETLPEAGGERPGMIFTLHGASVEATGQADAYASKTWAHIVAPTNRRPYGFDWEDWGRLDFLEVYEEAMARFKPDPSRVWLTGHSMGGHGTWQIGAQYPGLFGAIAPSAGWVSMRSYAGAAAYDSGSAVEGILARAASPSDTLGLKGNYGGVGVYILHGSEDDNVPVEQARTMRGELAAFHTDFSYYERPGAGHWWGGECVDWPPLMEFLRAHPVPDRARAARTAFTTMSPGVSPSPSGWATVLAQVESMKPSSVDLGVDAEKRAFSGKTVNVARLALGLGMLKSGGDGRPVEPVRVKLDGGEFEIPIGAGQGCLELSLVDGAWRGSAAGAGERKTPEACGPFKEAFRNGMVFVVGTRGSDEERAWALARARFDAETFWYRGNGSARIVPDSEFEAAAFRGRNVILYGNADTNGAWAGLLASAPIQVGRGRVVVGKRTLEGEGLACLFLRPKPGEPGACVGVVSGSGMAGMRLTSSVPYFRSGVGLPDWIVLGVEALDRGVRGIRGAGFFDSEWRVSGADSAWAVGTAP